MRRGGAVLKLFAVGLWLATGLPPASAQAESAVAAAAASQPRTPSPTERSAGIDHLQFEAAAFTPERIKVTVYLPPGYARDGQQSRRYPVLYANDGQDMPAVGLQATLAQLQQRGEIAPVIVVAVDMLADRASAYGLFDRATARSLVGGSAIGPIGTHAQAYSAWLAQSLVPWIDAHYRTRPTVAGRTVLGWSLGALNAFSLAWQYPEVFGQVGAFSPSFWLAADRSSPAAIQRTRLAQAMVDHGQPRTGLRLFFSVGMAEETADRDGDGVIDAVEDVQQLVQGYRASGGPSQRGLQQLGYRVEMDYAQHPSSGADAVLLLVPGGKHNQAAWKQVLPVFLRWAFGGSALIDAKRADLKSADLKRD